MVTQQELIEAFKDNMLSYRGRYLGLGIFSIGLGRLFGRFDSEIITIEEDRVVKKIYPCDIMSFADASKLVKEEIMSYEEFIEIYKIDLTKKEMKNEECLF